MSGFQNSSGTSYGGPGQADRSILGDISGVRQHANHHAGNSADDSIFGNALAMLQAKEGNLANEDVDEDHMVKAHKSFFGSDSSSGGAATSGGIGAASAMQALKMFNGGTSEGSSGSSQQEFIGMAMGQASKLFGELILSLLGSGGGYMLMSRCREAAVQRKCRGGRVQGECRATGGRDGFKDGKALMGKP